MYFRLFQSLSKSITISTFSNDCILAENNTNKNLFTVYDLNFQIIQIIFLFILLIFITLTYQKIKKSKHIVCFVVFVLEYFYLYCFSDLISKIYQILGCRVVLQRNYMSIHMSRMCFDQDYFFGPFLNSIILALNIQGILPIISLFTMMRSLN